MQYALTILTYLFDMFILTTFLMNTLHHFKKRYAPLYLCVLVGCECCLYGCEVLNSHFPTIQSEITATLISLGTTFILCLFFTSSLKAKLYVVLLFQILASLGEAIFTFLFTKLNPDFYAENDTAFLYSVMNIGSKVVLFILCLLMSLLFRKQTPAHSLEYKFLILSTPIISIIIYVCLPLQHLFLIDNILFYELLIFCLVLLNIINYILIQKEYASTALKYTNAQMEDQIRFQKEKYEQLSESYRQSRRIIHDLKKQYFCINEYVDNKEYDKLKTFTSEAVRDIESTYSKYNTGNLAIDSFLTNYDTLAAKNHIQFVAKLGVTYNRIPVNDYDLCVILGNMLDNCLKACIANPSSENFIHIAIATTENDKFTIHCENTTAEGTSLEHIHASRQNSLYHGYGLTNIRNTAEKYHGFFTYSVETLFYMDLMIPIIEKSKRIMH